MIDRTVNPDPDLLLRMVWRLLRPLVRLLINAGVPFPRCAELLRQLYVDVAMHDVVTEPEARTDSRISLMTGIHRKELRRLRGTAFADLELPPGSALWSELIGRWLGSPPWIDEAGQPLPLPRIAAPGLPSFDSLVVSVTKDVRPRAVLDQLLSQGRVFLESDGSVVLEQEAFLPKPGQADQLFYFARNLHDHIAGAVANITAGESAPFLDRSVHYDKLSPEAATRLRTYARRVGMRMLVQVNREALRLVDGDVPESDATERVNVGLYIYAEPDLLTEQRS